MSKKNDEFECDGMYIEWSDKITLKDPLPPEFAEYLEERAKILAKGLDRCEDDRVKEE